MTYFAKDTCSSLCEDNLEFKAACFKGKELESAKF